MTKDMTRGSPARLILTFALPLLLGNLCQQLYSMADSIIVGRTISMEALAAVGATGGIGFLVLGCVQGLTAGFAVVTAQRFGAGDDEGVKRSIGASAMLCAAATILLTAAGLLTARPLLTLMNTPANIIGDAYDYIVIIYYGVAASAFYNLLSCVLRALGDSKTPLLFLILASVLNVGLDLLFILSFRWGVAGAAWATIISQAVSAILCLVYAMRRFPQLKLRRRHFKMDWGFIWQHLRIALPMAMQFVITGISVLVYQTVLNGFGSAAVAAFSAASRIHMLAEQATSSFGTAMANYTGQNYGAEKISRIRLGVKKCSRICMVITVVLMALVLFFGRAMSAWFIEGAQPDVISMSYQYLFVSALFYPALTMLFIYRNTLLGLGNGVAPMLAGGSELLMRLAGSPVLGYFFGYFGLCLVNPFAWIAAAALLFVSYLKTIGSVRYLERREEAEN